VTAIRADVNRLRRIHPDAGLPTTFEITTALALGHFVRAGCTVAVIEVGLGGRLDATNAIDPVLSIITPISRDHTAVLGRTLAAIATEKAGIMRTERVALLAPQRPSAAQALRASCRRIGACCVTIEPLARGARLSLAGDHQRVNAALAVAQPLLPLVDFLDSAFEVLLFLVDPLLSGLGLGPGFARVRLGVGPDLDRLLLGGEKLLFGSTLGFRQALGGAGLGLPELHSMAPLQDEVGDGEGRPAGDERGDDHQQQNDRNGHGWFTSRIQL